VLSGAPLLPQVLAATYMCIVFCFVFKESCNVDSHLFLKKKMLIWMWKCDVPIVDFRTVNFLFSNMVFELIMDWEILEYCKADMFGRGGGGGQTQGKKTVPRPEFRPAQTEYKSCMIGKKSYSRVS